MYTLSGLSWWLSGKESNARAIEDIGWIPESGRFLGGGHGNPLQYSCLEKPMDRGAWQATVHGVTESHMTKHSTHTQVARNNLCEVSFTLRKAKKVIISS